MGVGFTASGRPFEGLTASVRVTQNSCQTYFTSGRLEIRAVQEVLCSRWSGSDEDLTRFCFCCTAHQCTMQEALAAGHCFFLSANGVLLCEGPLPVGFVEVVPEAELTAHFNLPQG